MALFGTLTFGAAAAQEPESAGSGLVAALIDGGDAGLSFRYRYEHVKDDAFAEDADASTLRSRLWFQSGTYRDFAFLLEAEDVREIVLDDFDAGAGNTPGRSRYPVVADPEGTEVNQAYLDYTGVEGLRARLGRQRINLDDQRFVGGVGWRQNEQTYDALSVDWEGRRGRIFYALVDNVNRVFGEDVPAGDHRQDPTHLLNLGTDVAHVGRLTGYFYVIDNEDEPGFSSRTAGLRLEGERRNAPLGPSWLAVYARQSDWADNPVSYDADYWYLKAGVGGDGTRLSLGWEVLTGATDEPGSAFRTPLATLHAFNGWADQFLTTPDAGLEDLHLIIERRAGDWILEGRAHRFEAEDGSARYGEELDLRLGRRLGPHLRADLFAALFDGDDGMEDVAKIWVMISVEL